MKLYSREASYSIIFTFLKLNLPLFVFRFNMGLWISASLRSELEIEDGKCVHKLIGTNYFRSAVWWRSNLIFVVLFYHLWLYFIVFCSVKSQSTLYMKRIWYSPLSRSSEACMVSWFIPVNSLLVFWFCTGGFCAHPPSSSRERHIDIAV